MAPPEPRSAIGDFKRATSATMRALAKTEQEIDIVFGPDPARIDGNTARLQMPARNLPEAEVRQIRGESDAMALKKRFHDVKTHRRLRPKSKMARAIYDAVEQVRCEALGSRHRAGVADNLYAALEEQCRRKGYTCMTDLQQGNIPDLVALLAREAMTGRDIPSDAKLLAEQMREKVTGGAMKAFARMNESARAGLAERNRAGGGVRRRSR